MRFSVKLDPRAIEDIQYYVTYYNEQQQGLGRRYFEKINEALDTLKTNPYCQVRYDEVRCFPVKVFPFMIHFTLKPVDRMVLVHAVIHTSLNPKKYWIKK